MSTKSRKRSAQRAQTRPPAPQQRRPRPSFGPKRREPEKRRGLQGLAESPGRLYAIALGAAVVVGALMIGLSVISANGDGETAPPPAAGGAAVSGISETAEMLDGVPQKGNLLGSSKAPFQLVEYSDPQCPFCARFAVDVLPTIVRDYVRTNKIQLVFRGLSFLGDDSVTAMRTITAAAQENKLWNVSELLYANQGAENSGWVTEELLRSTVTAAGASATNVLAERDSAVVTETMNQWGVLAQAHSVQGVPAFFIGPRGGPFTQLQVAALTVPDFRVALNAALKQ